MDPESDPDPIVRGGDPDPHQPILDPQHWVEEFESAKEKGNAGRQKKAPDFYHPMLVNHLIEAGGGCVLGPDRSSFCNFFHIFVIKNLVLDLDLNWIGFKSFNKAWIPIRINKSLDPDPDLVNLDLKQRIFQITQCFVTLSLSFRCA
jgi:hypothetical protein